jgi:hypothetical protein
MLRQTARISWFNGIYETSILAKCRPNYRLLLFTTKATQKYGILLFRWKVEFKHSFFSHFQCFFFKFNFYWLVCQWYIRGLLKNKMDYMIDFRRSSLNFHKWSTTLISELICLTVEASKPCTGMLWKHNSIKLHGVCRKEIRRQQFLADFKMEIKRSDILTLFEQT